MRETLFIGGPFDGQIRMIEGNDSLRWTYVEQDGPEDIGWPTGWHESHYTLQHFMAWNSEAPYDGSMPDRLPYGKGAITMDCWVAFAPGWEQLISVIVPTIAGREFHLARCLLGYRVTCPGAEVIVVENAPSCGQAWADGAAQATGEYLHFTADDMTPAPGWFFAPVGLLDTGIVPVANVYENGDQLRVDAPMGSLGHYAKVMVPFLTRSMLDLGDWFLPIQYGSDDWVTYRAAQLGLGIEFCPGYRLAHHLAEEGRNTERQGRDITALVAAMDRAGYTPPYYEWLRRRRGL